MRKKRDTNRRRYFVRCCQCGALGEMLVPRPPRGWLEVFVNPKAWPRPYQPLPLVVRICPDCQTPNQPARFDGLTAPDPYPYRAGLVKEPPP